MIAIKKSLIMYFTALSLPRLLPAAGRTPVGPNIGLGRMLVNGLGGEFMGHLNSDRFVI